MNPRCPKCGNFMKIKEITRTIDIIIKKGKKHRRVGRSKYYVCINPKRDNNRRYKIGAHVII